MRKTLLVIAVLSVAVLKSQAQQCTQTLRLAQSVYDQGRLHELEPLLEACLKSGFSDQEKINAYKLLTLTYIYLEEPEKADLAMLHLLQTDNEYHPNPAVDPAEFVSLYETFKTAPVYRIGAKVGTIASSPAVKSAEYANEGTSAYKYNFGFSAAITGEIPLQNKFKKFTFNPEIAFQISSFSGSNTISDNSGEFLSTTVAETQTSLAVPLSLQYNLLERSATKNIPTHEKIAYVGAGVSLEYLLKANQTLFTQRINESPVEEKTFDVTAQRNLLNARALLYAGFKRKFSKGYITAEVRAHIGLMPSLKEEDQYENQAIVSDYKYVDAIYRLNALSVSVGYTFNRYTPKKLILQHP